MNYLVIKKHPNYCIRIINMLINTLVGFLTSKDTKEPTNFFTPFDLENSEEDEDFVLPDFSEQEEVSLILTPINYRILRQTC